MFVLFIVLDTVYFAFQSQVARETVHCRNEPAAVFH